MDLRSGKVTGNMDDTEQQSQSSEEQASSVRAQTGEQILDMLIQMQRAIETKIELNMRQTTAEIADLKDNTNKNIENTNKNITDLKENTNKNIKNTNKNIENTNKNIENTNKNIEKLRQETNETQKQTQLQLAHIQDTLQRQLDNMELKIKEVENKCEKNLETMEKKVENKITEELDKQVTEKLIPIQQKVGEIQERLRTRPPTPPERIQVVVNGGISRAEPDKKFNGDTRTNPKIFIKNLEGLVENMGPGPELKKLIRSMLRGDAELWYDIVEEGFCTMQEFSHLFLRYFWGDHVQSKIRENLFNGKYNENIGSSREKYAMKKYSTAKQLDPPMSEEDIIKYISRHFDPEVTNSIALHEINQIGRLLDYLKRIDEVRRPRKNFYRRDGGSAGQEQRPENKYNRWDDGSTGQQNRPERQNNRINTSDKMGTEVNGKDQINPSPGIELTEDSKVQTTGRTM